jgi:hypothetical protein
MSNVTKGGSIAGDEIEERLARHFAAELDRARRDYPNLGRADGERASTAGPKQPRLWPRLALPVTAVVIVVAAGLAIAGWAYGPLSVKSGPVNPGATGVAMGSDGLPAEIEGQHVYRLDAQYDWQKLSGSFLLGAYAVDAPIPCAWLPSTHPQSLAEADLVPQCGVVELTPHASDNTEYFFALAPRGLDVLTGWLNGPGVVMRVHTHDPEAVGCAVDSRTACETAVVVEAVVWTGGAVSPSSAPTPVQTAPNPAATPQSEPSGPTGTAVLTRAIGPFDADGVPTTIGGERVYRATNMPVTGSFYLGGVLGLGLISTKIPQRWPDASATQPPADDLPLDGVGVGVGVGVQLNTLGSLVGSVVVARVARSQMIVDCFNAPCSPVDILTITGIVWTGPPAPASPPAAP